MTDVAKLIAETRELDAKATAGPWSDDDGNVFSVPLSERREAAILRRMKGSDEPHPDGDWNNPLGWVCGTEQSTERFESDSRLIARYRTLAPQLADEVERLAAEVAELRRERDMPCAHRLEEERIQVENARLRALLIEATPNGETCHNWRHNAESCRVTTLPRDKWCWHCRVCALLAETEVDGG